MKLTFVIAALATVAGIASAALPVQPPNAFEYTEDQMHQQQVVGEHNPVGASGSLSGFKSYIVVFKESAAAQVVDKVIHEIEALGGKIGHRYTSALKGFSAKIPNAVASALTTNPFIDYIEEDGEAKFF